MTVPIETLSGDEATTFRAAIKPHLLTVLNEENFKSAGYIDDQLALAQISLDDKVALASGHRVRASNAVPFDTWTALAATVGMSAGDRATVLASDLGTHIDPVVGGVVNNAGVYSYSAAPVGWQRVADLDSSLGLAAKVSAEAARDLSQAYANAAAAAASAAVNRSYFGSVLFPLENGFSTDVEENAEFRLPGFNTANTGMTASGANAFWYGPETIVFLCDPAREVTDGMNGAPAVVSTDYGTSLNRFFRLVYNCGEVAAGGRRKFSASFKGESGPARWDITALELPDDAPGPYVGILYNDATNGYIHVYCRTKQQWFDGPATAKPASWAGLPTITNPLCVGGTSQFAFPANYSPSYQNSAAWRGTIDDVLFCRGVLSKADALAFADGGDPVALANAAAAAAGVTSRYLHIPLTDGSGNLTLAVSSSQSAVSGGLTQNGRPLAGAAIRRQGANSFLMDRLMFPAHFGCEDGATSAPAQISGTYTGITPSAVQVRLVDEGGGLIRDWRTTTYTASAGVWTAQFAIPRPLFSRFQIQARMMANPTLIACSSMLCQVGPVIDPWSQSEHHYSSLYGYSTSGNATGNNTPARGRTDTVLWATKSNYFHIRHGRVRPQMIGDAATVIANAIRRRTQEPVMICHQGIAGTSAFDLMDDSQSGRLWTDVTGRHALVQNRGRRGEHIITGDVWGGWEAFLAGGVSDIPAAVLIPWLRGIASGTSTSTSAIAQAQINHWRFDGWASMNSRQVVLPCNRQTVGASATTTDASTEADQRDSLRNYSHLLGYSVGPDQTTHKMEGENAAGGLPAGTVQHPEINDWEGSLEMAESNAEAYLMAMGYGRYPGPVFFETGTIGAAGNEFLLTSGNPRPQPGELLANPPSTGYSTGYQRAPNPSGYRLYTKKAGGDPGAGWEARRKPAGGSYGTWSKANVVSGSLVSGRTVKLITAFVAASGDEVQFRYHPGSPGNYSSATITQEAWRSGALYFGGDQFASGSPEISGWPVSGSNQAITVAVP